MCVCVWGGGSSDEQSVLDVLLSAIQVVMHMTDEVLKRITYSWFPITHVFGTGV